MTSMHIAQSGKNKGKWVPCQAGIQCTISSAGAHASSEQLKAAKKWLGLSKISDVTETDRARYMKAVIAGQTVLPPAPRPAGSSLLPTASKAFDYALVKMADEEKQGNYATDISDRLTADERAEAEAIRDNLDGRHERVGNISFSPRKWKYFVDKTVELDILVPLDVFKEGSRQLRNGATRVNINGVPMRGDEKQVNQLFDFLHFQ